MRRRSERSKGSAVSPEKTTRKSTRRSKRSNSRASDVEKQPSDEENELSGRDSSSEREGSRTRRKLSRGIKAVTDEQTEEKVAIRSRRSRKAASTAASTVEMDTVVEEGESVENGDSETDAKTELVVSPQNLNINNNESEEREISIEPDTKATQELPASDSPEPVAADTAKDDDESASEDKTAPAVEVSSEQVPESVPDDDSNHSPEKEESSPSDSNSQSNNHRSSYRGSREHRRRSSTPPPVDESKEQSPVIEIPMEVKCGRRSSSSAPQKHLNKETTEKSDDEPMEVDQSIVGERFVEEKSTEGTATNESESTDKMETTNTDDKYQKQSKKDSPEKDVQMLEKPMTNPTEKDKEKEKEKPKRKRKWLSQKSTEPKPQILAISTDSLRNIIADVKPVPLSDVKLESSPEPELITIDSEEKHKPREKEKSRRREREEKYSEPLKLTTEANPLNANRKISIVHDGPLKVQRPPSPPKNSATNILYITNLVRPFTVLQLKGLLARTGKICENGFWIDKIKSKCYVKYETEDEAVETRHALHGIRWPASNPKCLNVDFGTVSAMGKAIASTSEDVQKEGPNIREERVSGGWDRFDMEERREPLVNRPIREWDLGKKEELQRDRDRDREREKDQQPGKEKADRVREKERERERSHRGKDVERRRRSSDRIRRSPSISPPGKYQRKENDPPIRLLDDLFRKTKATPCIYWLPLTAEQIAVREEARRKHLAEHKRRLEESSQKTEKDSARDRGDKERDKADRGEKERDRLNNKDRRERSDDRRKDSSRNSKSRDGDRDRRRY